VVGIENLRTAASEYNEKELRPNDPIDFNNKLRDNPFKNTFRKASDVLTQPSQEFKDRMARRAKEGRDTKKARKGGESKQTGGENETKPVKVVKGKKRPREEPEPKAGIESESESRKPGSRKRTGQASARQESASAQAEVTPRKRVVSNTSFGTQSTETTPIKFTKPETSIQQMQNYFVTDILDYIYNGVISIPWARNRNIYLRYTE